MEVTTSLLTNVALVPATDQLCSERNSGGKYFEMEHNVAWFTFLAPKDTMLTFDIVPNIPTDDIDFLLFKQAPNISFCTQLSGINNNDPVRTNLSKVVGAKGETGLSKRADEKIVDRNGESPYSKAVSIKQGERYYLIVDDKTQQGAITLVIHLNFNGALQQTQTVNKSISYMDANPVMAPRMQSQDTSSGSKTSKWDASKIVLTVKVVDSNNQPVNAQLDILGLAKNKTTTVKATRDSFALDPLQSLTINANAGGYIFSQTSYIAPGAPKKDTVTIILQRVMQHKSIVLKGIEFEQGNDKLLPSSNGPLMNVVTFLKANPNVNILIKGYVNDPSGKSSPTTDKKLSRERAGAVLNYLRMKGISLGRMDYAGFGNADMIFPEPVNSEQEQANRRVEIEIR